MLKCFCFARCNNCFQLLVQPSNCGVIRVTRYFQFGYEGDDKDIEMQIKIGDQEVQDFE